MILKHLFHTLSNVMSGLNHPPPPLELKSAYNNQELDSTFAKPNKAKTWCVWRMLWGEQTI